MEAQVSSHQQDSRQWQIQKWLRSVQAFMGKEVNRLIIQQNNLVRIQKFAVVHLIQKICFSNLWAIATHVLKQKNMSDFSINQSEFSKDVDSVNKLSSATAKIFGTGVDTENYLPDIKDVR